ncbi:hypothetical protein CALCODRAFT_324602 [Calocera cornea HHB12733]|uniref:Uncharacterized protein n=1 Tax=Calocera cornea HHB12733 TaxID=1353952 RepID=A0A165F4F8_9BASI|nr:hypothetical protein CALCODRAFT_324602 [Calocera cornea HHB12733]
MYARKTAALLLWPSRPTSPALSPADANAKPVGVDAQRGLSLARPLNALMRPPAKEIGDPAATVGLVAESYCTLLGMKLNEAVAKALVGGAEGPIWDRRRPVPAGKGRALGLLISGEFMRGPNGSDTFTQRAILRSVQRPLSVLLTNIQGLMTPLLAAPQFLPTSPLPATLPAAQVHALALAAFAGELHDALLLPSVPRFVQEGLAPFRAQLSALETRACLPIVTTLKTILTSWAADLSSTAVGLKEHPSVTAMNQSSGGTSKLLHRLLGPEPTEKRQIWAAELLAHVAWQGMVGLVYRSRPTARSCSPERTTSPPPTTALPSSTDRAEIPSRFGIKQLVSRPVTPAVQQRPTTPDPLSRDSHAFQSIIAALASTLPAFTNSLASDLLSESLLSLAQLQTLLSLRSPPSADITIPDLDLLPSALVLTYLLPEGKLASLSGMDPAGFRIHCLGDENHAEQCEGRVEQVAREWVANKDEYSALHTWLVGEVPV